MRMTFRYQHGLLRSRYEDDFRFDNKLRYEDDFKYSGDFRYENVRIAG